ncbi:MBL fold metallo-hydrolase [Granulicoccus phenolivorans]|uniref:MBL fold metallo-hydrolase n=1 Tax=Granulicoccus phenolivorans TaxID=266854 RepID=UPI00040929F5|nr:MBL fold metallo-hydrolase [Granulicoccus phenolivorans]
MATHTTPTESESAWREVAAGVHLLTAEPDTVTIGLVVGSEAAVLIDTGSTPAQGARLRARVAEVTDVPLVAAVITHGHRDHWFGLAGVDVPGYGHESLVDLAAAPDPELQTGLARAGLTAAELRAPEHPVSLAGVVALGDRRVELIFVGAGHSRSDLVALVPGEGERPTVIFAGDLVESLPEEQPTPQIGPDADLGSWVDAVGQLMGLAGDAIIVPGHGAPVDARFLDTQGGDLAQTRFLAQQLAADGVPLAEAEHRGEWPLPWAAIEPGVRQVYAGIPKRLPLI